MYFYIASNSLLEVSHDADSRNNGLLALCGRLPFALQKINKNENV